MDALSYLLCLLVGVALPLGFTFVAVRRAWLQIAVAESYRTVSKELRLSVDTRGVSLHGLLEDRALYVGEVLEGHGTQRRLEYKGMIELDRPLGLGLLFKRRASRWRRPRGSRAIRLGDEQLDKHFDVFGDDDQRVRALFDDGVKAAIAAITERWPDVIVTDHHIRVQLQKPIAGADRLRDLVAAMRRVADALLEARRRVSPPVGVERQVEPWRDLAGRLGLEFEPSLPSLAGAIDGRRVQVTVRREEDDYAVEARVWFADHPVTGIRMRPQTEPDGYWSVGQDIQVGDPAFDPAFVIKGYHPGDIVDILRPEVRAGLLALLKSGYVEVDDRLLRVRGAPLDPAALQAILTEAVRTAAAMW